MPIKTIIFDFDGTIADTWKAIFQILKENQEKWNLPDISPETIADFRKKGVIDLIKKYNIVLLKLPFVIRKAQKELKDKMRAVRFYKDMKEVILDLKKKGYVLGILTTNSKENVNIFLH